MLQIKEIRKQYVTGDLVQTALNGVSLNLRDNEFVAILGPSGSGKTTLLNVIGGLDRYDSGDLIINGISTKKYSDRDWDSYRNHTIGFVFQSYNLIPHQTVLANVELALTISGISRSERRRRATKALEDVGLGNQLHKKPNQMSGGQMQRVAIARALVNDPSILLADEPTGALDSDTSVQVMELLKEVSKDRLVVMVTHNPELAEEYANRIVRVKDGNIIGDTNPFAVDETAAEPPKHKNMGRSSMSFFTALGLSFNNLSTKKARTLLTAFAGSIGIIGIALIMSLSTGFQKYIDKIQEDTLSNYPLSIQSETADMTAALAAFGSAMGKNEEVPEGTVLEQQMIVQMFAQIGTNDLSAFKTYLEGNLPQVEHAINNIRYSYGIRPRIYSADTSGGLNQVNPANLFGQITGSSAMSAYMDSNIFSEMIGNIQLLSSQYQVLRGRWPENYNELIVVLSDPGQISDYMAYTLGMKDATGLNEMIQKVMAGEEVSLESDRGSWTYDDLMNLQFRLLPSSARYRYNSEYGVWEDMSADAAYMKAQVDGGEVLQVVGIVCPKEGVSATTLSTGICYTEALTRHVIAQAADSQIVASQLASSQTDVFTGKPFGAEEEEGSGLNFEDMISVDGEALTAAFGMEVDEKVISDMLTDYMEDALDSLDVDTGPAQKAFLEMLSDLGKDFLNSYIAANADPVTGEAILRLAEAEQNIADFLATEDATARMRQLEKKYYVEKGSVNQTCKSMLLLLVSNYITGHMPQDDFPEVPEVTLPDVTLPEVTLPDVTLPEVTLPDVTLPDVTLPDVTLPEFTLPEIPEPPVTDGTEPAVASEEPETTLPEEPEEPEIDLDRFYAAIKAGQVDETVADFLQSPLVQGVGAAMGSRLMMPAVQKSLTKKLAGMGNVLMEYIGSSFYVDEEAIASAFQFNMNEEELRRLMEAMSGSQTERSLESNLRGLGYAELEKPSSISIYFTDFAGKEDFLSFLDDYNVKMEDAGKEDQIISYTDVTGIMMSSVRTIIDSVSYVLIAFVAVSLIVSSIMIGIITYISVMERTKEIGVLRAIGASKRNISQVFNAETFIIGLCSGLLGVGITLLLNFPINKVIHAVAENNEINAQLPPQSAVILIVLSMVLTLIGGLIPSSAAAKKDPVIALRSE